MIDEFLLLTDDGIETTLINQRGIDLPAFAAFPLIDDRRGRQELRDYYDPYLALAAERGLGFILEAPTWRASARWAAQIGVSADELDRINRAAIELLTEIRLGRDGSPAPIPISGCIGPREDEYEPGEALSAEAFQGYHRAQVNSFSGAAADLVTAMTMATSEEAIGIVRAAREAGIPAVISFTVEPGGRLPSGQSPAEAIAETDARSEGGPAWYMINCAHPSELAEAASTMDGESARRVRGLRLNASRTDQDAPDQGDPVEFGRSHLELQGSFPKVRVLGGCCSTDHRHVEQLLDSWQPAV